MQGRRVVLQLLVDKGSIIAYLWRIDAPRGGEMYIEDFKSNEVLNFID